MGFLGGLSRNLVLGLLCSLVNIGSSAILLEISLFNFQTAFAGDTKICEGVLAPRAPIERSPSANTPTASKYVDLEQKLDATTKTDQGESEDANLNIQTVTEIREFFANDGVKKAPRVALKALLFLVAHSPHDLRSTLSTYDFSKVTVQEDLFDGRSNVYESRRRKMWEAYKDGPWPLPVQLFALLKKEFSRLGERQQTHKIDIWANTYSEAFRRTVAKRSANTFVTST